MDSPQIPPLVGESRETPSNLEAEQSVIGSVLADNRIFDDIAGIIAADRFYEPTHKKIFALISRMIRAGHLANVVTVSTAFKNEPDLRDLGGGREYLGAIASAACSSLEAVEYARVIRDMACCRDLINLAEEAKSRAYDRSVDGEDWSTIAGRLRQGVDDLSSGMTDDRVLTGDQVIVDLAKKLEQGVRLVKTGIARLDESFGGGVRPGKLYSFEAPAKHFKSGIATALFEGVIRSGRRAMFLTLEMSPEDIFQRQVAGMAGLGFNALEDDRYKDRNISRVFEYQAAMGGLSNAYFMHIPGATYSEVMAYAARARSEYGCDLLVVDYWQRIRGEETKKTDAANLEMIANHLADLLEKTGMAGVLASQLNREGKSLGSDGLQRACSWRAKIHKEEFPVPGSEYTEAGLWLEVSENRYGPSGHVGEEGYPAFRIAPGPVLKDWNDR